MNVDDDEEDDADDDDDHLSVCNVFDRIRDAVRISGHGYELLLRDDVIQAVTSFQNDVNTNDHDHDVDGTINGINYINTEYDDEAFINRDDSNEGLNMIHHDISSSDNNKTLVTANDMTYLFPKASRERLDDMMDYIRLCGGGSRAFIRCLNIVHHHYHEKSNDNLTDDVVCHESEKEMGDNNDNTDKTAKVKGVSLSLPLYVSSRQRVMVMMICISYLEQKPFDEIGWRLLMMEGMMFKDNDCEGRLHDISTFLDMLRCFYTSSPSFDISLWERLFWTLTSMKKMAKRCISINDEEFQRNEGTSIIEVSDDHECSMLLCVIVLRIYLLEIEMIVEYDDDRKRDDDDDPNILSGRNDDKSQLVDRFICYLQLSVDSITPIEGMDDIVQSPSSSIYNRILQIVIRYIMIDRWSCHHYKWERVCQLWELLQKYTEKTNISSKAPCFPHS